MRVLEYVRGKLHRYRNQIFRNCFHTCSSIDTFQHHEEMCCQDEGVVINMPKPGKGTHRFKSLTARWYVLRVIYFDLELLLLPVYGPQPTLKNLAPKQNRFINHAVTLLPLLSLDWEKF